MNFRWAARIHGVVMTVAGFLLMAWGPVFLISLGDAVHADLGSASLIRFAGVAFCLAGALLLAVRDIGEPLIQERIGFTMFAAASIGAVVVWAQQSAIWNAPLGFACALWLSLIAATFASVLLQTRRPARL